jgi:hypothetical protein
MDVMLSPLPPTYHNQTQAIANIDPDAVFVFQHSTVISLHCFCRHMAEVLPVDGHADKTLAVLLFTNVQNSRW